MALAAVLLHAEADEEDEEGGGGHRRAAVDDAQGQRRQLRLQNGLGVEAALPIVGGRRGGGGPARGVFKIKKKLSNF